jgi:transcriptional regulator with XRE-family HTH domain
MSDSDVTGDERPARPRTVAEKLTRLFKVLHPPGARPLSTREVAKRVKQNGGSISSTYISELRSGVKTNPSLDHIIWLAAAFGVSASYFTDPDAAERVDAELDRVEALHQRERLSDLAEQTVAIHERTADLNDSDRAALAELVQDYWHRRKQRRDT